VKIFCGLPRSRVILPQVQNLKRERMIIVKKRDRVQLGWKVGNLQKEGR
jgi:hypothetical protein